MKLFLMADHTSVIVATLLLVCLLLKLPLKYPYNKDCEHHPIIFVSSRA